MDAEASKQIAELALKTFPDCTYRMEGFLKGAQAAWDLAVKTTLDDVRKVVLNEIQYREFIEKEGRYSPTCPMAEIRGWIDMKLRSLNPPKDEA